MTRFDLLEYVFIHVLAKIMHTYLLFTFWLFLFLVEHFLNKDYLFEFVK